jgi:hypothetical protein
MTHYDEVIDVIRRWERSMGRLEGLVEAKQMLTNLGIEHYMEGDDDTAKFYREAAFSISVLPSRYKTVFDVQKKVAKKALDLLVKDGVISVSGMEDEK